MKIRCIALDLDQTTLDGDGRLSPANRAALEHAISQGIHIVIASGRPYAALPEDVLSVHGIEYAITSNGAAVYHLPTGHCLHRCTLTPVSVEEVLSRTAGLPLAYEVFIDGRGYAQADYVCTPERFGACGRAADYVRRTRQAVEDITSFIRTNRGKLDSLDLVTDDLDLRQRLREEILCEVGDLYITTSMRYLLELSNHLCGKHAGVQFVADRLGLSPEQLAAFGDGDNDADMLSYVGEGIAMANASPLCLAAAHHITLDHRHDGVAYGIRTILGI